MAISVTIRCASRIAGPVRFCAAFRNAMRRFSRWPPMKMMACVERVQVGDLDQFFFS